MDTVNTMNNTYSWHLANDWYLTLLHNTISSFLFLATGGDYETILCLVVGTYPIEDKWSLNSLIHCAAAVPLLYSSTRCVRGRVINILIVPLTIFFTAMSAVILNPTLTTKLSYVVITSELCVLAASLYRIFAKAFPLHIRQCNLVDYLLFKLFNCLNTESRVCTLCDCGFG